MSKISVNKLGEYIEANPTRRRRIVFDQKNPAAFIVTRYSRAKEIAIEYFINNFDDEILIQGIEELDNIESESDFQENDIANSLEFLVSLLEFEVFNFIDFDNIQISRYVGSNPKLNINNVEVSVNPDLIFSGTIRNRKVKGALKFHFSKTSSLNTESAKNIATLIHQFVEDNLIQDDENADIKFCLSLDVFAGICESAPRSYMRRRDNIRFACTEIDLWWDNL
ncbi:hypothetical protein VSP10_16660 [Myroides odoratimimus]|uniref:Uncharacterized protein n=1 Tax=Myroides odoratimimus CIP 101113 TaxID=883154 RepID=A0AAV3F073_9FLAO|nr:hypothetical protein [Myroides odoratimimus]EHO07926.1 hypothetical protein HMPREF9715_02792 [Myroides odoratimimus CIP 101113]MEC4054407.1 hypothetical protein [Myroides odoratimimus]